MFSSDDESLGAFAFVEDSISHRDKDKKIVTFILVAFICVIGFIAMAFGLTDSGSLPGVEGGGNSSKANPVSHSKAKDPSPNIKHYYRAKRVNRPKVDRTKPVIKARAKTRVQQFHYHLKPTVQQTHAPKASIARQVNVNAEPEIQHKAPVAEEQTQFTPVQNTSHPASSTNTTINSRASQPRQYQSTQLASSQVNSSAPMVFNYANNLHTIKLGANKK